MMDLATAVGRREAAGTEQARRTYRRHGARDPLYGVSFAVLDELAKEAKRDQVLADGLWATGNFDCRLLACKVADPADWTSQAGWDLRGQLALKDATLDDAFFLDLLEQIEAGIGRAGNRTRHAMNGCLIAIGARNEALRVVAEAAAGRIGVVVDHGETGCRTPAAMPYIAKTWDRKAAKAGTAGA